MRGWRTNTLVWSCIFSFVAGAILLYGAGFYWIGQWETGKQVQHKLAVAACVRDFLLQPDRNVIYAKLKASPSAYQRRELIRNHKFADDYETADQCDGQIRGFAASNFPAATETKAAANNPA
jgi:hypothetical protein